MTSSTPIHSWRSGGAIEAARSQRPISETAFGAFAPGAVYLLGATFVWAIRGFRQANNAR